VNEPAGRFRPRRLTILPDMSDGTGVVRCDGGFVSRKLAVASSTVVLSVGAAGLAQALAPEGEEAAFQAYVAQRVGDWPSSADPRGHLRDELWVASHSASVLAEGRRACDWLAQRPSVDGIDRSGRSEVDALITRYLAEARGGESGPLSTMGERIVVAGAWAHLCKSVRDDKD
jgi:hypothetical protein